MAKENTIAGQATSAGRKYERLCMSMGQQVLLIAEEFRKRDHRYSQEDRSAQKNEHESNNRCRQCDEKSGKRRRRVTQYPTWKANGQQRQARGGYPSRQQP